MKYLFLIFFNFSSLTISPFRPEAKVIGIKDGDTIEVLDTTTKTTTMIRLAEIDCPEKSQPFGMKAKQMTSDLVYGKFVKYEKIDEDRYGRTVAKVYYNDSLYLSETLVKNGMAWVFRKYSNSQVLRKLQYEARENKAGLWIDSNAIEPSIYRQNTTK